MASLHLRRRRDSTFGDTRWQ